MAFYRYEVSSLGATPIPDQATVTGQMNFPYHVPTGVTPTIEVVYLSIVHEHLDDLDVTLRGPDGTAVELFTDVGGSCKGMFNINIYDSAPTDIDDGVFPAGGFVVDAYFNADDGALLQTFATKNLTGNWGLSITDDAAADVGHLLSWGLLVIFQYNGVVNGNSAKNALNGSDVADLMRGFAGNDTLKAWLGNDTLIGGLGRDTMFGGPGRDIFDFNALSESRAGAQRDTISDFTHGDDIDLRTLDANTHASGNQAFHFVGTHAFSHVEGELRYTDLGARCLVQGDVNGDGKADFEIMVKIPSMIAGDFLL